jgi:hypothetical protein
LPTFTDYRIVNMETGTDLDQTREDVKSSVLAINPKLISKALLGIIGLLLLANLMIIYLKFGLGHHYLRGFIEGFYFDGEANFPSLYSAITILFSAFLLWRIGVLEVERRKGNHRYWKFLSVVFCFLAIDEFASLHEYLIEPTQALLKDSGLQGNYFYFAWFIPYSLVIVILGIVLLRFYLRLPLRTRVSFVLAASIFVSGAVGMEMIGGDYWVSRGWSIEGANSIDVNYALIVTIEELLEMLGIVVFIQALSEYYLKREKISLMIHLSGMN